MIELDAAIVNAQRPDVHALAADADAAIAKYAARTVEVHHRRPLLLVAVVLDLDELRLGRAVLEGHVLQFALAARIAHRAVERMVAEQQLQHGLARLLDLVALGADHHALGDRRGAGRLQLGHLLDFHQAHAAGALQRQAGVVAEGRHLDACALAGLNEERSRGNGEFLAVNSKSYVSHKISIQGYAKRNERSPISLFPARACAGVVEAGCWKRHRQPLDYVLFRLMVWIKFTEIYAGCARIRYRLPRSCRLAQVQLHGIAHTSAYLVQGIAERATPGNVGRKRTPVAVPSFVNNQIFSRHFSPAFFRTL